jgi:hypothetical protein
MMTSSPGFTSAVIAALIASLAPQVTTISVIGSMARRVADEPLVERCHRGCHDVRRRIEVGHAEVERDRPPAFCRPARQRLIDFADAGYLDFVETGGWTAGGHGDGPVD